MLLLWWRENFMQLKLYPLVLVSKFIALIINRIYIGIKKVTSVIFNRA